MIYTTINVNHVFLNPKNYLKPQAEKLNMETGFTAM